MSHAEKWLDMVRNGEIETAKYDNADSIPFDDGSEVRWDGRQWFVAFTARVTVPKTDRPVYQDEIRLYEGTKHDAGKVRWSLLPAGTISMVLQVLEYGAAKYEVDNWQHVSNHRIRYYDAAMRHINAWLDDPIDPDSGLPHLAHAMCCLLFLMWFDKNEVK